MTPKTDHRSQGLMKALSLTDDPTHNHAAAKDTGPANEASEASQVNGPNNFFSNMLRTAELEAAILKDIVAFATDAKLTEAIQAGNQPEEVEEIEGRIQDFALETRALMEEATTGLSENNKQMNPTPAPKFHARDTDFAVIVEKASENIKQMDTTPAPTCHPRDADFDAIVHKEFTQYAQAERTFFLSLSATDRAHLSGNSLPSTEPLAIATLHWKHLKLLFTLKGLKPCTLLSPVSPSNNPEADKIMDRLVTTVLKPIIAEHNLEAYGFALHKIEHAVPTERSADDYYQNQWLFIDLLSSEAQLVTDIFLVPHPDKKSSEYDIGRAFGYPVVSREEYAGLIHYYVGTFSDLVMCYFIPGGREDCAAAWAHYKQCYEVAQSVGVRLGLFSFDEEIMGTIVELVKEMPCLCG